MGLIEGRTRVATAAVALVTAMPVATWTLVGDLSSEGFAEDELDYLFRAPGLPWAVELVAGALAAGVIVASATVLGRAVAGGRLRRQWMATVVPLAVAGAVLGFGGRVLTAGGIGANIGGGLFVLLGLPFLVVLVIAAALNAWVESRRS